MALRKSVAREDPQPYILKKNFKKAAEIYRKQIQDNPDDANLHLRLGDVLVSDGQTADAVQEYKRAAQRYADAGFLLKAIGVNKKIVKIDPSQEAVHQALSDLYEERGLLASPAHPATPAADPGPAPAGGPFQFDLDESEGPELELGVGLGADEPPTPVSKAAPTPQPEPEFSVDDLSDALADLPEAFDELPAPDEALSIEAMDGLFEMAELEPAAPVASASSAGDTFAKTPLFSDFTADELVEVVKQMGHEDFGADHVVVREGEPGDALFVIIAGSVRVMTQSGVREVKLADLGEGAFFGEGSLITGKPRTATIITNEPSELLSLSKQAYEELAAAKPRVREVMIQFYQERAQSTVQTILGAKK